MTLPANLTKRHAGNPKGRGTTLTIRQQNQTIKRLSNPRWTLGFLRVTPIDPGLIETVREKFTCRDCEKITQPPAPFHATPRGFIGPQLLATILFDKFGMHIPLNRQSARFK